MYVVAFATTTPDNPALPIGRSLVGCTVPPGGFLSRRGQASGIGLAERAPPASTYGHQCIRYQEDDITSMPNLGLCFAAHGGFGGLSAKPRNGEGEDSSQKPTRLEWHEAKRGSLWSAPPTAALWLAAEPRLGAKRRPGPDVSWVEIQSGVMAAALQSDRKPLPMPLR